MRELIKYGESYMATIPAISAGAVDFDTSITLAAGDAKLLSHGGGSPQVNTNLAAEMVPFTSLSEIPTKGDTIDGATSGASGTFIDLLVTSGSPGGGDGAGFLFLQGVSGTFQSENLNINGGTSNVMTIGADTTAGLVGDAGNGDIVFALTSTETSCRWGNVSFVDSATKDWEDNKFYFATYGNASAMHAFDFDEPINVSAGIVESNLKQIDDSTAAMTGLKNSSLCVASGSVAADGANSATSFQVDATLAAKAADYFGNSDGGLVLVFIAGTTNEWQSRRVTAFNTTTDFITVEEAFASTPSDDDEFVLLGRITELS